MSLMLRLKGLFVHTVKTPPRIENFSPSGLEQGDREELTISVNSKKFLEFTAELADISLDVLERTTGIRQNNQPAKIEEAAPKLSAPSAETVIHEDVFGITFAIEYEDSCGNHTRRRITLRHIYADNGVGYIRAYCHERKENRTFRLDRIINIIDADGAVYEAEAFFRDELRIDWDTYLNVQRPRGSVVAAGSPTRREAPRPGPVARSVPREKPGLAQRRAARDGTRVLTALARADGHLHEKELAVIMAYIGEICELHGICVGEEDRAALVPYLKRQRPDEEVLESCLEAIALGDEEQQRRFLVYAIQLADADGVLANEEFQFLAELQEQVAA